MSETVKEIFLETAEENGWLDDRFVDRLESMARDMLSDGESIEKVVRWTRLPVAIVENLLHE